MQVEKATKTSSYAAVTTEKSRLLGLTPEIRLQILDLIVEHVRRRKYYRDPGNDAITHVDNRQDYLRGDDGDWRPPPISQVCHVLRHECLTLFLPKLVRFTIRNFDVKDLYYHRCWQKEVAKYYGVKNVTRAKINIVEGEAPTQPSESKLLANNLAIWLLLFYTFDLPVKFLHRDWDSEGRRMKRHTVDDSPIRGYEKDYDPEKSVIQ